MNLLRSETLSLVCFEVFNYLCRSVVFAGHGLEELVGHVMLRTFRLLWVLIYAQQGKVKLLWITILKCFLK